MRFKPGFSLGVLGPDRAARRVWAMPCLLYGAETGVLAGVNQDLAVRLTRA